MIILFAELVEKFFRRKNTGKSIPIFPSGSSRETA
jgi:hypothetical protein